MFREVYEFSMILSDRQKCVEKMDWLNVINFNISLGQEFGEVGQEAGGGPATDVVDVCHLVFVGGYTAYREGMVGGYDKCVAA